MVGLFPEQLSTQTDPGSGSRLPKSSFLRTDSLFSSSQYRVVDGAHPKSGHPRSSCGHLTPVMSLKSNSRGCEIDIRALGEHRTSRRFLKLAVEFALSHRCKEFCQSDASLSTADPVLVADRVAIGPAGLADVPSSTTVRT